MTTHKDVSAYLTRLYPQVDPEVAVLDIRGMLDISAAQILDAITTHRQSAAHGFPPTPGELRAIVDAKVPSEAQIAWERYQELKAPPHYGPSDISWFDGSGKAQAKMDAWTAFRSDPRRLAAMLAAGEVSTPARRHKAFLEAFRVTALRLARPAEPRKLT